MNGHETSTPHINAACKWVELEERLIQNATIDQEAQKLIKKEELHWRAVLERLLQIVQYLAERNQAFRGSSEKLGDPQNGNFLGLVEMIARFDPVLCEHTRRIKDNEIADHYLGKNMHNEFIQLLGNEVLQKIKKPYVMQDTIL